MNYQARPEGGATGALFPGSQPEEGPSPQAWEGPLAQAEDKLPRHTDKFVSFMFQIKIK